MCRISSGQRLTLGGELVRNEVINRSAYPTCSILGGFWKKAVGMSLLGRESGRETAMRRN